MQPFENKRKLRYVGVKTGIVVERVDVRLYPLRYRDSKGRLSKFTTKKKLSVEIIMDRRLPNQPWKKMKSVSYGLPLKKRKKPVNENVIQRQIINRLKAKAKKGHTITSPERVGNLWSWSYKYYERLRKKKKGSKNGRSKGQGDKVSKSRAVQRGVSRAKSNSVRHRNRKR